MECLISTNNTIGHLRPCLIFFNIGLSNIISPLLYFEMEDWSWCEIIDEGGVNELLRTLPKERWSERDSNGECLFRRACLYGEDPSAVASFIQAGFDVNESFGPQVASHRPIDSATGNGNPKVVELLLASGANIEPRGIGQNSVLDIAVYRHQRECARVLIANGARLVNTAKKHKHEITLELISFEYGVLRCRSVVIAMIGIKKYRGENFKHVDRFLFRQMALEIWVTRSVADW